MTTTRCSLARLKLQHTTRAAPYWWMHVTHQRLLTWAVQLVTALCLAISSQAIAFAPVPPAPALTLASHYHPKIDLQAYWVSEKYDGIRAHWTGHILLSRQGHPIEAPSWFTHGWPHQALDGELWAGRNQFAVVQSAVAQGASNDTAWRSMRYMVFDTPHAQAPFAQRQQVVTQTVQAMQQPWVIAAPQWQIDSHSALMRQLRQYTQAGAEGLMLRHAQAPYRGGRSQDLIKVKLFEDAEAVVRAHIPGKGKYSAVTGALWVELPNGQHFKIGSGLSDADRINPPPVGRTITYRYNGTHPSGLPRFARFLRTHAVQTGPSKEPKEAQMHQSNTN